MKLEFWLNEIFQLRALFTFKILSHCSEPMREDQFGRWLCPLQSAIRISMTQNLQCEKSSKWYGFRNLQFDWPTWFNHLAPTQPNVESVWNFDSSIVQRFNFNKNQMWRSFDHWVYAAKTDQLKIFDDQKIENAFCSSFYVSSSRITLFRTKIWTFDISSTAKMSEIEKLNRNSPFSYSRVANTRHLKTMTKVCLSIFLLIRCQCFIIKSSGFVKFKISNYLRPAGALYLNFEVFCLLLKSKIKDLFQK